MTKYPDVILGPPPTTLQVKIGVIVMLVVAAIANACSFILLAGLRKLASGVCKAAQAVCGNLERLCKDRVCKHTSAASRAKQGRCCFGDMHSASQV